MQTKEPKVRVGIDIIFIPDFKEQLSMGGAEFKKRVLHSFELSTKIETLAGIFASKEAVIKALGLPVGSWLQIEVKKSNSGKPEVILPNNFKKVYKSWDLSISHAGDYAVAVFVAVLV